MSPSDKFKNLTDSHSHQNFQIKDPYSIFQVLQQQEEPTDLEKSMKFMIRPKMIVFKSKTSVSNLLIG